MTNQEFLKHIEESMERNSEFLRRLANEEFANKRILQREQTN